MNKTLEICCYTFNSAVQAGIAGADRIELCDNYFEGGTTPSYAVIESAVSTLAIPVNVIIRPRGGNFNYSQKEFEIILKDIEIAKSIGANGVVTGILKPDGMLDIKRMEKIVDAAGFMEVTFHRAFDVCRNPLETMEILIGMKVTRILTSGGAQKADEGIGAIATFVERASGRIEIMPGSGITDRNLQQLVNQTGATAFHSSAKTFQKSGNNPIVMGSEPVGENNLITVDTKMIEKMAAILHKENSTTG